MVQSIRSCFCRLDKNTIPELSLLALWIAGSSLGLWTACRYGGAYASFLQPLAGVAPDLGGVFASAIFPLLLSACLVFLFQNAGCYGMCMLRAFSQGLFLGLVRVCYGAAAPLMAFLLGFSGLLVNGVLLFFWLRRLRFGDLHMKQELPVLFVLCTGIAVADYCLVGPFLVDVVNL